MRYMVFIVLGDPSPYENGAMPSEADMSSMMTFNEMLANQGVMLSGDGFYPTANAVRIAKTGDAMAVTPGPFTGEKIIGGYWMWKVDSEEQAIELAKQCPISEGDELVLRRCFEMEDFEVDPASELGQQVERLIVLEQQNNA